MKKYKFELIVLFVLLLLPIIWTFKFLLISVAILGVTFIVYCYETAQLVDECFKPLEPIKRLKDTKITKVILLVILFFIIEEVVGYFFYPTLYSF